MVTNTNPLTHQKLLYLLQLASPSLPVGAYSYSEGLETLVANQVIQTATDLQTWLEQELTYGSIRLEAAVMVHVYPAAQPGEAMNLEQLKYWNAWLSAWRESAELRQQSWQMGRALLRLLQDLDRVDPQLSDCFVEHPCNFAIGFVLAAAHWQLDRESTILAYLQSWSANLINAGIKLIPLGQTAGQRLMLDLHPTLQATATAVLDLPSEALQACNWGLSLASMQHETQYSRLFRS